MSSAAMPESFPPRLTPREWQVARLLASGCAAKEIACQLDVSLHTARRHTEHVYQKLNVRSRVVAALAIRDLVSRGFGSDACDQTAA